MKRLFEYANEYVAQCTWKELALVKVCLCSLGVIIGLLLPAGIGKIVLIVAAVVFLVSYIILMKDFFGDIKKYNKEK